jgi:hypothetical protein
MATMAISLPTARRWEAAPHKFLRFAGKFASGITWCAPMERELQMELFRLLHLFLCILVGAEWKEIESGSNCEWWECLGDSAGHGSS